MSRLENIAELQRLVKVKREAVEKLQHFLYTRGLSKALCEEIMIRYIDVGVDLKHLPSILAEFLKMETKSTKRACIFVGSRIENLYPLKKSFGEECSFIEIETFKSLDSLEKQIEKSPDSEIHLILEATSKEEDLLAAIHFYSAVNLTHLGFQKIDETLTLGTIVNVMRKSPFPTRFLISNNKVFDGEVDSFIKKILMNYNEKEYEQIRRIVRK